MNNPDHDFLDDTQVDDLGYEQAFDILEKIVTVLETEELPLERSLMLYERGQSLARHCASLLENAELRIRQLSGDNLVDFQT